MDSTNNKLESVEVDITSTEKTPIETTDTQPIEDNTPVVDIPVTDTKSVESIPVKQSKPTKMKVEDDSKTGKTGKKLKNILTITFVGVMAAIVAGIIILFLIMSKNYTMYANEIRTDLDNYKDSNYIFMLEGKESYDIPDEVYEHPDDYTYMVVENVVSIIKKSSK